MKRYGNLELLVVGFILVLFGYFAAAKPKKLRDFYARSNNRSKEYIEEMQNGYLKDKYSLVLVRVVGVFAFLFGLAILIVYFKSI